MSDEFWIIVLIAVIAFAAGWLVQWLTGMRMLLLLLLLSGCTSSVWMPVKKCIHEVVVHPETGAIGTTTAYPCWEPAKDSVSGTPTRLLYLMDKSERVYSQEVGP